MENVSAIWCRSGKKIPSGSTPTKEAELRKGDKEDETPSKTFHGVSFDPPLSFSSYTPKPPFPSRLAELKEEEQGKEILDTFKKVQVNIPLLDAVKQIPKYEKFLKELCTNKRKKKDKEKVKLSKNVSAVLQNKMSEKCKDPSMFTLPYVIGETKVKRTMLDLRASINVMPFSVYQ
jgi:hypothetical protein